MLLVRCPNADASFYCLGIPWAVEAGHTSWVLINYENLFVLFILLQGNGKYILFKYSWEESRIAWNAPSFHGNIKPSLSEFSWYRKHQKKRCPSENALGSVVAQRRHKQVAVMRVELVFWLTVEVRLVRQYRAS